MVVLQDSELVLGSEVLVEVEQRGGSTEDTTTDEGIDEVEVEQIGGSTKDTIMDAASNLGNKEDTEDDMDESTMSLEGTEDVTNKDTARNLGNKEDTEDNMDESTMSLEGTEDVGTHMNINSIITSQVLINNLSNDTFDIRNASDGEKHLGMVVEVQGVVRRQTEHTKNLSQPVEEPPTNQTNVTTALVQEHIIMEFNEEEKMFLKNPVAIDEAIRNSSIKDLVLKEYRADHVKNILIFKLNDEAQARELLTTGGLGRRRVKCRWASDTTIQYGVIGPIHCPIHKEEADLQLKN